MKIGYVRISTKEQNTARQDELMESLGVEKVYTDKMSGKDTNRPGLEVMMDFVREGDIKPRYLIQCQLQHKQKKCEKQRFRSIYSIQNRHFSFGKNYPVGERNRSKLCLNPLPAI